MTNTDDKNSFKPHLVEIEERPVSPIGRKILWSILIMMGLTLLWLFLGKTDVVVSGRAQVMPVGDVKAVQALSVGSVKKIYVKEGDFVKKGDPLIEIDPTVEETNIEAKKRTLALLELEVAKINSLLNNTEFVVPSNVDPALVSMIRGMYDAEKRLIVEQEKQIEQQIKQIEQQIEITQIEKEKVEEVYRLGMKEQKRLEKVLDLIAKSQYYELKKKNIQFRIEITKLEHELLKYQEQLHETKMKKDLLIRSFQNKYYEELAKKKKETVALRSQIETIEFKRKKQVIVSPVDGIIAKVGITTIGAVVQPAQALMTIVPEHTPIELKAKVANKDIGFIKVGMPVAIKIDAFNFQRYGLIDGNVTKIGANAINDKKFGLIYEVYIKPKQVSLMVEGEEKYLIPGMTATAEFKVGSRRIIEFFVYPLIKYFNEGISVR
jgi:hemolysin D